ncbi:hypothetical protein [uncultured Draconibacterium sp.]|uniref:hypothetical protein n=1 Tax=uncultured Draconibacterium sp. TaxID=1573823 RepID=UPI0025EE5220|nr:hypothetical protein [uncultured Draconibacterium sp.]
MATKTPSGIPEPVITEATSLISNALTVLKPYLIALTPHERQVIAKMDDRTYPFVEKTCDYTLSAPQFVPPYMDVDKLKADLGIYDQLTELLRLSKQLTNGLDDSKLKIGGEGFTNALSFYNSVKQAAKINVPGAKSIHEDLKKRFMRNRSEKGQDENKPDEKIE